jgi:homoaconitase/3-isopropylmalate dehydratase large subunit
MFYFDNDRHSTNAGAIGALGFRMGSEISRVLATGTNWVMVPKTIRLTITGRARPGVFGRDIGFVIAKHFREGGSWGVNPDYRVLEFAGDIDQFDLAQRTALCSSPTEVRAYGTFFPPSAAILAHATAVAQRPFTPVYPDENANYEAKISLDISSIEPQVALPGWAGWLQAAAMEMLPGEPLMSRDNVLSMSAPNVATPGAPGLQALGITPTALEAVGPGYLGDLFQRQALDRWREGAGRG